MTDRLHHRGQAGYALPSVLAVFVVFVLISGAILALVVSGLRMTRASIEHGDDIRAIDGALETGLQRVRNDRGLCNGSAFVPDQQGYAVACDPMSPSDIETGDGVEQRTVHLTAESASGLKGRAQVRILDIVTEAVDPADPSGPPIVSYREGFSVEVCDWLLGSQQASKPLRGCT